MIARDIEEFERQKHLQSSPVQVSQYTSPIPRIKFKSITILYSLCNSYHFCTIKVFLHFFMVKLYFFFDKHSLTTTINQQTFTWFVHNFCTSPSRVGFDFFFTAKLKFEKIWRKPNWERFWWTRFCFWCQNGWLWTVLYLILEETINYGILQY
jgi:hypothetical protein